MQARTPDRRGLEVLEAVRKLGPSIRAEAEETERAGRLPESQIEALKQAGVFGMAMPLSMGGPEADPLTQLEVVEALSIADGSVGWIAMIASDGGYYAAHLEPAVAERIYADRNAVTASVLVPRGQARRVDGGYRVTGRWPFGSASLHADWFVGGCIVVGEKGPLLDDRGQPLVRMTFFAADECEVLDNWQTTGLAGSGSNDWQVDDVFVPEEHSFSLFEEPRVSSPLFAYPWLIVANAPGVSLGIARAAIDSLCALAEEKQIMPGGHHLRDELLVQAAVGHAEAELGAARSYLVDVTGSLWRTLEAGDEPSLAQRATFRLAGIHAFRACKDAVGRMYEAGGGSALYARSPLDRHWRDIATITQHAFANEKGYGEVGRAFMGLDPRSLMI
ncbi:MAG: acyl-CoA dehydrogenase family protein [Deltaproteobacteria bacterium]|jgi:alkylation response protein AidB-like acyl-CoA dehydrogenase|nr:acyl-CoA dehydrogenase family protein [Deltaproteobacteria bacterium]